VASSVSALEDAGDEIAIFTGVWVGDELDSEYSSFFGDNWGGNYGYKYPRERVTASTKEAHKHFFLSAYPWTFWSSIFSLCVY
jgi:hypothetical protein